MKSFANHINVATVCGTAITITAIIKGFGLVESVLYGMSVQALPVLGLAISGLALRSTINKIIDRVVECVGDMVHKQ